MRRRIAVLAAVVVPLATAAALAAGSSRPRVGGCTIFPANNPWNQRVDKLPVASNSDAIVRGIGVNQGVHADFGSGLYNGGPIGIPYTTVGRGQTKVKVKFDYASESDTGPDPNPPPMGLRFRLKASFPVSRYPRQSRIVLQALQRYGMIVADNGSDWYLSGAPNKGWNNDDLHSLGGVTGGNFEVVDTSSLPHP